MRDAGRRPMGRLLYWYWAVVMTVGFWLPAFGLPAAPQGGGQHNHSFGHRVSRGRMSKRVDTG